MPFHQKIIAASVLLVATASAAAAPTADLQVAGKVLAAACTLGTEDSTDLDFEFDQALPGREFVLSKGGKSILFTAICGGKTSVALKVRDNGGSKLSAPMYFRFQDAVTTGVLPDNYNNLQDAESSKSIGAIAVRYLPIAVDNVPKAAFAHSSDGIVWSFAPLISRDALSSSSVPYMTASSSSSVPTPAEGQRFDFRMEFGATVLASEAPPTVNYSVSGSITMELISL